VIVLFNKIIMKKILVLMMLAVCVQAEMFGKKAEPAVVVLSDGTKVTEGQIVTIGKMSFPNHYNYIKTAYRYDEQNRRWLYSVVEKDLYGRQYVCRRLHTNTNIFYNDHIIANVVNNVSKATLLLLGSDESYQIDLLEAVRSGEIILSENPDKKNYREFTEELAFLNYLKLKSANLNDYKEEYLYRYMNDLYVKTHDDEFQYGDALKMAAQKMSSQLQSLNPDEVYSYKTVFMVGAYDDENKGFPIYLRDGYRTPVADVAYKERLILSKHIWKGLQREWLNFENVNILFYNISEFGFLKVDKDFAESFIRRRKDDWGTVKRDVYAKINFKVKELTDNDVKNMSKEQ